MEDQSIDDGVDISITDEIDSDADLTAASKPKGTDHIEQDNL